MVYDDTIPSGMLISFVYHCAYFCALLYHMGPQKKTNSSLKECSCILMKRLFTEMWAELWGAKGDVDTVGKLLLPLKP